MSRVKLSEFRAKKLINPDYDAQEVTPNSETPVLVKEKKYVLKVDQAEKGRFKKGLVKLDVTSKNIDKYLKELRTKGYEYFIVEEMVNHAAHQESFLSLSYDMGETLILFSSQGGIDIEGNQESIVSWKHGDKPPKIIPKIIEDFSNKLAELMQQMHIVFLEINPLVIEGKDLLVLDCAMEVDDAAEFFVRSAWSSNDYRSPAGSISAQEKAVLKLNEQSPASFNLKVLNPNGEIFVLLSGGGASLVLADALLETFGQEAMANYGEYSGGPSRSETRQYTVEVLELLLQSKAKRKTLLIGGGVANFTDVQTTFEGVVDAFKLLENKLKKQNLRVFVRRGGPRQEQGLKAIAGFFESIGIKNSVHGPDISLSSFVRDVMKETDV